MNEDICDLFYQLTLGQFVNEHISVDRLSRTIAGHPTKIAQFGLSVLLVSILGIIS